MLKALVSIGAITLGTAALGGVWYLQSHPRARSDGAATKAEPSDEEAEGVEDRKALTFSCDAILGSEPNTTGVRVVLIEPLIVMGDFQAGASQLALEPSGAPAPSPSSGGALLRPKALQEGVVIPEGEPARGFVTPAEPSEAEEESADIVLSAERLERTSGKVLERLKALQELCIQ